MHPRFTHIPRLARRASLPAMLLALPVLCPAQTAPASAGRELSRTVSTTEDGRELIVIRALPPAPSPAAAPVAPPPAPSPTPTTAEKLEELRLAAKKHDNFTVFAVVYPGRPVLTELRWTAAGREWLAYSNIDFHALTQLTRIETADTVFQWFPFVSDGDAEGRPHLPGLGFSGPEAEYLVYARRTEWAAAPEAFAALDELHAHYQQNRQALDAALALRRAEAARLAAEPPPPPKPVIVRYYQPVIPAGPAASAEGGAR